MKKPSNPQTAAVFFGIAGAVLFWISITSYWSTHELIRSYDAISQTHQALDKIQHIDLLMESAESSVRGYVITGEDRQLNSYRYAKLVAPVELRQMDGLMALASPQKESWQKLSRLLYERLADLSTLVFLRRSRGYDAAAARIAAQRGAKRGALDRTLSRFQQDERAQLESHRSNSSDDSVRTTIILALAGLMSLGFLAWAFGLVRRETDERLEAENTTLRTETFLDSIVERIPYMILVKETENLRLTLVNKAAEEWLGRPRKDLLGSNDLDLRPREEAMDAMEKDREALREGKPVDIDEERLALPGKEERALHTQKVLVPDIQGNPAYLLTISEDITQRKLAERMLELTRDAAVESARLKSEFIRNMSHEIRTPLSVVSGMTDLLLGTELTEEQRRFATMVRRAAEGLTTLSKSVLDFSKIEAGAFSLEILEFNPRQVVGDVIAMLGQQAKAKGITLVSLADESLPLVLRGDPIRLRQVLAQLIGNAVKFTQRGEVLVRMTEARQSDSQVWLNIRITDTGIGISEDIQKHVFQAFRQGDGSPTRKFGGTGLGLAISKRILELMGGEIGFESAPGKGSTFWVTVPFNKPHVQGPVVQAASRPWAQARVLIIDENETVRQIIQDQLRSWALVSEAVSTGQTALELLRREQKASRPFSIVLIDMQLPDMDGVIFAKMIKGEPALAETKLIVMTSAESALDAQTAATFGFSGVLTKPPKFEELHERLASVIDSHKPLDPGRIL